LKEGFKQSYKISVDTAAYCAKKARYAFTGNVFHPIQCTYVHNIFVHVKGIFDAQLWRTKLLQCPANNLSIQVVRWRSNLPPWRVFRVCWQQHLLKRGPHLYARSTVNATVEWMLCSEQSPTTLPALYIQENSCVDQHVCKWLQVAGLLDHEK